MKSFIKKLGYVTCLSIFCLSLFSFKSSHQNEQTFTNSLKETQIKTSSQSTDPEVSRRTLVKTAVEATKKVVETAKQVGETAVKVWEKSSRVVFHLATTIIFADDTDTFPGSETLSAEHISKQNLLKISKL